jgi:prevent-host-death family protein
MQIQTVSKSQFKTNLLAYLRQVEKKKQPLLITHAGKITAKVVPYTETTSDIFKELSHTVISYQEPTEPVGQKDWEALQ